MNRFALSMMLAGCGPAVSTASGTEGASGTDAPSGSSESSGGGLGIVCMPALGHASVNRDQLASSLAAVLCIAQEGCCRDADPSPSCRHRMNMHFEEIDAEADELGLTYDGACAGYQQALVDAVGCEASPNPDLTGFGTCSIYFGDAPLGAPCTPVGTLGSSCAQGLACLGETCVDPCGLVPSERRYVYGFACPQGDVVVDGECYTPGNHGDSCRWVCSEGLICPDVDGVPPTCVWGGYAGDACEYETDCNNETLCVDEVCVVGSDEGEPCGARCDRGLDCDRATQTCVKRPYVCAGIAP